MTTLHTGNAEPNLDILRALAVLMVLGAHVIEMIAHQNPALSIHPYNLIMGRLGVLLFFVHTALVLNYSMERMRLTGWEQVRAFYIRRAARIYPLAVTCVLIVLAFGVPIMPWSTPAPATPSVIATNLTLTTNLAYHPAVITPLWSLPLEVQMYVALPIVYLIVRGRPALALALWALSVPIAWLQPTYLGRLSVLAFAPCFMGGVVAYTLAKQARVKLPAKAWFPTLILAGIGYLCVQGPQSNIHWPPAQWLLCLLVGALIPLFADSSSRALNATAAFVAKYSYGIYLFHVVAIWLGCVVLADQPYWLQWTVSASALILLAGLGYHYIEEPAIRLGSRLANRRARTIAEPESIPEGRSIAP